MSRNASKKTPAELGYFMPPEWAKHEATWLSWPHDPITFPNRLGQVEKTYVQIVQALSPGEKIHLLVKDPAMQRKAERLLKEARVDMGRLIFHLYYYADVWFRDYGPIFLINKKDKSLAMTHWIFNAWGGKYEALRKDTEIPAFIQEKLKVPCFKPGVVLEGGSIDVNGKGVLMTTEQCLLNNNRNPHLTKPDIAEYLREYLGVTHLLWLKRGIEGDDTDGHIDDVARFVDPVTVLCVYEEDRNDPNHAVLHENYEILRQARDQDGNPLHVIKLPTPGFVGNNEGRLPASYANFYIGNKAVLVPTFKHPQDRQAIKVIQHHFPHHNVVGIDATDLVHGLGAFHCITQQQPA